MKAIVASGHRAPVVASQPAVAESGQYLTFMLAGEMFALGILNIKEIIEFGTVTAVPMMPPFIRGVINLRGRVVPVVDLAVRFGRDATSVARRTSIVIIETRSDDENSETHGESQDIGIMVDAVNEVIEISAEEIEPPPAFGAGVNLEFIHGMAKRDSGFVIVLELNRALSVNEMVAFGQEAVNVVNPAGECSPA